MQALLHVVPAAFVPESSPDPPASSGTWELRAGSTRMQLQHVLMDSVFPTLLLCLNDYTTDNRGDVGSLCAFMRCRLCNSCAVLQNKRIALSRP
jgi:hypothetical protein